MNKPRLTVKCYECDTVFRITRKELATVGNYAQCSKHRAEFRAWLTGLAHAQG